MGSREWVYHQDRHQREYVVLDESGLLWVSEGPKDLGGARDQTLASFLAEGPPFAIPDGLADEIRREILARAGDGRAGLERDAAAILSAAQARRDLRDKAERQRADEMAAARALKDPWRSYAAEPPPAAGTTTVTRSPPSIRTPLVAAALFACAAAIGAGLARLDLPSVLAFLGLAVATMAAGFALYWRMGSLAMLLASFLAAGGAGGTLHIGSRLHELTGGEMARLASIAQAPQHPAASRFTFAPAQAAGAFRGTATGTRSAGKNKEPQRWSTLATPLVPAGWTRERPVPAWLVCNGGGDSSCLRRAAATLGSAVIPPQRDRADLRAAIDDAIARHRLVEAAGAPMLVAMPDIDGEVDRLSRWTWYAPLGAFGLWLAAWLGGLAWRRFGR